VGKENDHDEANRTQGLHLRLQDRRHHRRLPLQSLHLQELRLLRRP
jgi:hypothetical protein